MRNVARKGTRWYASLGFFCLFTLSLILTSCGMGENADGKIHLTLWYWNRSISDKVIAKVGEHFPNIVLTPQKITDYDNKVRTAMAGKYGVPDILGINSNISTYFPDEDQFVDLKTLGADDLKSQYLDWKWNLGVTPSNRMIGFPMDTGPTVLFYRTDLFEQAGLPTKPADVSNQIKTWDDYLQAAEKMKTATNGKVMLVDTIKTVNDQILAQSPTRYFTRDGKYIGDQGQVKEAWNEAAKAAQMGITAKVSLWTQDWNQAMANGRVASFVGASWMKQVLEEAAPDTSGKWRVTNAPGGAGNSGGSFLSVTTASQHPKEAFEVVKWLQNAENQLAGYNELQLFPSTIKTLEAADLNQPEAFFGGQNTTAIFSAVAKNVPLSYMGPYDDTASSALADQLPLMEQQNKNPDQAWNDAQQRIQRDLTR